MLDESFKEYTERRIKTFNKLKEYFPEMYPQDNVDYLRNAYNYENYLILIKNKLEELFGFKITWDAFDQTYHSIWSLVNQKYVDDLSLEYFLDRDTFDGYVEYLIDCKINLLDFLKIEYSEYLLLDFANAFENDFYVQQNWKSQILLIVENKMRKEKS